MAPRSPRLTAARPHPVYLPPLPLLVARRPPPDISATGTANDRDRRRPGHHLHLRRTRPNYRHHRRIRLLPGRARHHHHLRRPGPTSRDEPHPRYSIGSPGRPTPRRPPTPTTLTGHCSPSASSTPAAVTRTRDIAMTYNGFGQVATKSPVHGTVTFSYDAYGHETSQIDPRRRDRLRLRRQRPPADHHPRPLHRRPGNPSRSNLVSSSAYDPAGRLASTVDTMGWVTALTYPDNGMVVTVTRADPATRHHVRPGNDNVYDAAGNISRGRPPTARRSPTSPPTPPADHVHGATPTGAKRSSTPYSPDDAVLSTTSDDGNGGVATTDTNYDPLGRATSTTTRAPRPRSAGGGSPTAPVRPPPTRSASTATAAGSIRWSTEHGGSWRSTVPPGTAHPPARPSTPGPASPSLPGSTWPARRTSPCQKAEQKSGFLLRYDQPPPVGSFVQIRRGHRRRLPVQGKIHAAPTLNTWTHLAGYSTPPPA